MKQCLYLLLILFVSGCSSENEKPKQAFSEWFWSQRAYPTGSVNSQVYHQEKNKVLASRNNVLRSPDSWDFEGPTNIGGRVTDIEMIPSSMDLILIFLVTSFFASGRRRNMVATRCCISSSPESDFRSSNSPLAAGALFSARLLN